MISTYAGSQRREPEVPDEPAIEKPGSSKLGRIKKNENSRILMEQYSWDKLLTNLGPGGISELLRRVTSYHLSVISRSSKIRVGNNQRADWLISRQLFACTSPSTGLKYGGKQSDLDSYLECYSRASSKICRMYCLLLYVHGACSASERLDFQHDRWLEERIHPLVYKRSLLLAGLTVQTAWCQNIIDMPLQLNRRHGLFGSVAIFLIVVIWVNRRVTDCASSRSSNS